MASFKRVMMISGILGVGFCTDTMGQYDFLLLPDEDLLPPAPMEDVLHPPSTLANDLKSPIGRGRVNFAADVDAHLQTRAYGAQARTIHQGDEHSIADDKSHH